MIPKTWAILLLLSLVAGACLVAAQPVSDDEIYNNVRIKLSGDPVVKGAGLEVKVEQGTVTLTGSVEQEKQKDKATKLTKKIKGVKQVVNNIAVERTAAR